MDPLTAALTAVAEFARAYVAFLAAATPTQREALVQMYIDDQRVWRAIFARLIGKDPA